MSEICTHTNMKRPKISQEDQDSILSLLCEYVAGLCLYRSLVDHPHSLLSPIGQHRKTYIPPSKGQRSRAQKRKHSQNDNEADQSVPPPPAVAKAVDIGLTSITRKLQELSAESEAAEPYSIVFVVRSGPPSAFFSHLPQMVAVSCKSQHLAEPTRLVGFSKSCETRLSACMGIPRVTSVALREDDTAQARALVDFVRKTVPVMELPWLDVASQAQFQETKINTIQAPIGKKRQRKS